MVNKALVTEGKYDEIQALTEEAVNALDVFEGDTTYLKEFAYKLISRKN